MRVLHVTNWYASAKEPKKALFVREQVQSLMPFCENELIHVEIKDHGDSFWRSEQGSLSEWESYHLIYSVKIPWRVKEWLSHRLLLKTLRNIDVNKNFDIINIHTAYPLCSKIKRLQQFLKIPMVFTEHWTAFSFNFNLPYKDKSLNRIRRIYEQQIPILTVSHALGIDITTFSQVEDLQFHVIPNVIDTRIFSFEGKETAHHPTFFMVNYWRPIKSPFVVFEAFREILTEYPKAILRVGGYGPLWPEMKAFVTEHKLQANILLLGTLNKEDIARELQGVTSFVHATRHETFSLVTAEALMCGTPVVVSDLPCIAEYVDASNGILVDENHEHWVSALKKMIQTNSSYDRKSISDTASNNFSSEVVGKKYYDSLLAISSNFTSE